MTEPDAQLSAVISEISKKYETAFEPLAVDGNTLQTLAISNMTRHLDRLIAANAIHNPLLDLPLWAKIWPASFVLGRFLRKFQPEGKTMLELGCGMGICSLIASRYGFAKILATDINRDALLFAKANILKNSLQDVVSASWLDVRDPDRKFPEKTDFICASEILYLDELHRPLLKFVERNLAPFGKAFFCADLARDKKHFEKLAKKSFNVTTGCVGVKNEAENERKIYKIIILEPK